MKLPSGKLLKTVPGGVDSLSSLFDEFKGDKFSGYISTNIQMGEGKSVGQLVFKEGDPILSEHMRGAKAVQGKESVIPLMKDGLKEDAFIEVHGNIDVDLMALYFQKAKIEPSEFDLQNLVSEVENLQKQAAEDAKEKEALKARLDEWKSDGFEVGDLEELLDGTAADLKKAMNAYEKNLKKLIKLSEQLMQFKEGFPDDVGAAAELLKDPGNVPILEKAIKSLTAKAEENEERKAGLLKKVEEWRKRGFEVDSLAEVINRNVDEGWELFTNYSDCIPKLEELKRFLEKTNTIDIDQAELAGLKAMCSDPGSLADATAGIDALKEKLKTLEGRREEIKKQLDEWKGDGYKTDRLKGIMKKPLPDIEAEVSSFEGDLNSLSDLHSRFMTMEIAGLEEEVASFEELVKDPDSIGKAAEKLQEIEEKLKEIDLRKKEIRESIAEYASQGYSVEGLDPALEGDLDTLEKAFIDYQSNVEALGELRDQVAEISPEGIKDEMAALQAKLTDPFILDEIQSDLGKIQKLIKKREEKREEIRKELGEWRGQGFDVDRLEVALDTDLDQAIEMFDERRAQISAMRTIGEELEKLDHRGFEREYSQIRSLIHETTKVEDVTSLMDELKVKIEQAVERRSMIKDKVKRWKEDGIIVSALEAILEGDLEVLDSRTMEYEESIAKIYDFQERLAAIEGHEAKKKKISKKLNNPKMVEVMEKDLMELEVAYEEEKQARQDIVDQMGTWAEEGYVVTALEEALEEGFEKAQKARDIMAGDIETLKAYQELLSELDATHFKEKAEEVGSLLKDPGNVDKAKSELENLKDMVEADRQRRTEFIDKLEVWEKEGLNISNLLDAINNKPMDEVEAAFADFEKELEQLRALQQKFGGGPAGPAPAPAPQAAPAGEGAEAGGPPEGEAVPAGGPGEEGGAPGEGATPDELDEVHKRMMDEGLNPDFSFTTFVVGNSNRFTHAAAEAVSTNPAEAYNPLFIYGGSGLGKTHLITAISQQVMLEKPHLNVVYVSSEKFTNELIEAVRRDDIKQFRDKYRKADILIIDDIQFLEGKESTQEEFFHTFNALYNAHKQIVVTSDRPPKDITTLEERLKSRFEGGLITEIQPPSLETRVIILRRLAKKMELPIIDELNHHIASVVTDNIRELSGVLTKVGAVHQLTKEEITFEMVDNILKEIIQNYEGSDGPGQVEVPEGADAETAGEEPAAEGEGAAAGAASDDKNISMEGIEARLSSLRNKLTPMMEEVHGSDGDAAEAVEAPDGDAAEAVEAPDGEGAEAVEAPAGEADEEVVEDEVELVKCGSCDALIAADSIECPECGVSFGGEWYECPECGATAVNSISMKCESCGAEFEIEE